MSERTIHEDKIKTFGNLEDIIDSFENGRERFQNDNVFRNVVLSLYQGNNIISLLDDVLRIRYDQEKLIMQMRKDINRSVNTQLIVATQERINELKNEIES
jgi:hypothetical protein